MLGGYSGHWSPGDEFEDVEVIWPEPKRLIKGCVSPIIFQMLIFNFLQVSR